MMAPELPPPSHRRCARLRPLSPVFEAPPDFVHLPLDGGGRLNDERFWMGVHSGQPVGGIQEMTRSPGRSVALRI